MSRPRVYISGPISQGNRNKNQFQGLEAHKALMLAGFAPLNPIVTGALPFSWDADVLHGMWLDCDFPWIEVSQAVLRLPGYSVGADAECRHAEDFNVPVFYSIEDLIEWRKTSSDFAALPEAERTSLLKGY